MHRYRINFRAFIASLEDTARYFFCPLGKQNLFTLFVLILGLIRMPTYSSCGGLRTRFFIAFFALEVGPLLRPTYSSYGGLWPWFFALQAKKKANYNIFLCSTAVHQPSAKYYHLLGLHGRRWRKYQFWKFGDGRYKHLDLGTTSANSCFYPRTAVVQE